MKLKKKDVRGFTRRALSLLLVAVMLLSMFPVSILAEEGDTPTAPLSEITATLADDSFDAASENAIAFGAKSIATISPDKSYDLALKPVFPENAKDRTMTVVLQAGLKLTKDGSEAEGFAASVKNSDKLKDDEGKDIAGTGTITYHFADAVVASEINTQLATYLAELTEDKEIDNAVEVKLNYTDGEEVKTTLSKLTIDAPEVKQPAEPAPTPTPIMQPKAQDMSPMSESDPLKVTLFGGSEDGNDVVLNADTTAAKAKMTLSGNTEKAYDLKAVATFPADGQDRVVTITLAEGLRMVNDGSNTGNLTDYLVEIPINNEEDRITAPFELKADMKGSGKTTYKIKPGATVVQINAKIVVDRRYWLNEEIANGILIESEYTDSTKGVINTRRAINELTVDYGAREFFEYLGDYKQSFALGKAIEIQKNYTYIRVSESHDAAAALFYKDLSATYTISKEAYDSGVFINNTGADRNWELEEPEIDGEFVKYKFVYQDGNAGQGGNSWAVPVGIVFPATEDQDYPVPNTVIVSRDETATFYNGGERQAVDWNKKDTDDPGPGTYTFTKITDPASPFVNYLNVDLAVENKTTNTTTSGATSETMSGPLGYYTIGNKGGSPTGPVTVKLSFDSENIGVKSLNMPIPYFDYEGKAVHNGSKNQPLSVTEIRYRLKGDDEQRTAKVDFKAESVINQGRYVSLKDLGLTGDLSKTYLSEIEYDLPFIPACTVLGFGTEANQINNFYGVTFNTKEKPNQMAQSTITLSSNADTSQFESITGEINSDHSKTALYISSLASTKEIQMVNAGEVDKDKALNFSYHIEVPPTSLGNFGQRSYGIENPTFYIRSETGNPLSNIVLTSTQGGKSNAIRQTTQGSEEQGYFLEDATKEFPKDEAHPNAKIYRISTEQLTQGQAAVSHRSTSDDGTHSNKFLTLSFNIATKLDDEGQYKYGDMMFMETSKAINSFNANNTDSIKASMAQSWIGEDKPFGIGRDNGMVLYGLARENSGYYQIDKRTDISVDVQAKHISEPESSYTNWSAGDDPVPIGIGTNSAMDIRLQVKNNTGTDIKKKTEIYMPLPQKDEKGWGELLFNDNSGEYNNNPEFSLAFKDKTTSDGPIKAPNGTTVLYGKITPTDSESTLQSASFEAWNPSNAGEYNCIKIVVATMAVDDTINLDFKVTVKKELLQELKDGLENAWSPLYYQDLRESGGKSEFAGWKQGSYIASKIATGELQGEIWQDFSSNTATNKNGYKDTEDTTLNIEKDSGWVIKLYKKGETIPFRTTEIGVVGVDDNGDDIPKSNNYHFYDIPLTDEGGNELEYYMVVTNPNSKKYIFTKVIAASETGADKTANKAAGNPEDSHATATISNVFSAQPGKDGNLAPNAARYNIGILPITEPEAIKTTLKWEIRTADASKGTLNATGDNPTSGLPFDTIGTTVSIGNVSNYYDFAGWTTDPDGTTATIAAAGPFGDNGLYGYDDTTYYAVFTPKTGLLTVTYHDNFPPQEVTDGKAKGEVPVDNYNGHAGYLSGDMVTVLGNVGGATPTPLTRAGYDFVGWTTSATPAVNDLVYGPDATTTITMGSENIDLYAKWKESDSTEYKVMHFQQNVSGTGYIQVGQTETLKGTTGAAPSDAAKEPNNYLGFSHKETLYVTSSVSETDKEQTIAADGSLVIKHYYDRQAFNVSYNGNGNTGGATNGQTGVKFGDKVTVAANGFTKEGYKFTAWNTDAAGGRTAYAPSATFEMPASDVTLYAQWQAADDTKYIVQHFQENLAGTGYVQVGSDEVLAGTTGTEPSAAAQTPKQYPGFEHKETLYFTKLGGETGTVQAIAADGSLVVKHYYDRLSYDLTYDGNGATGGATDGQTGIKYDAIVKVADNGFTREGYEFTGWNTDPAGSGISYSPAATFKMLAGNVTLYAQWKEREDTEYKVLHLQQNLNGTGYTQVGSVQILTGTTGAEPIKAPNSYVGFNYKETLYVTSSVRETDKEQTIAADGSLVIKHYYDRKTFTLSYNGNGATGGSTGNGPETLMFGAEVTVLANGFTKDGYNFTAWNTDAAGGGTTYALAATFNMPASDVTLFAQWEARNDTQYKVQHFQQNLAGTDYVQVGADEVLAGTTDAEPTITPTTYDGFIYTRTSYQTATGGETSTMQTIAADGSLVVKHYYDRLPYDLNYDGNGATGGATDGQTGIKYDAAVKVADNGFTREGYEFTSWNTDPAGGGKSYSPAATFNMPADNVTLYAQWKERGDTEYKVLHLQQNLSGTGYTQVGPVQTLTGTTGAEPIKTPNSYVGFNYKETLYVTSNVSETDKEQTIAADGSLVIKHYYDRQTFTLSYNGNGATGGSTGNGSQTIMYGARVSVLNNGFTRSGHNFSIWNTTAAGSGNAYSPADTFEMPAGDVTLFAQWSAIPDPGPGPEPTPPPGPGPEPTPPPGPGPEPTSPPGPGPDPGTDPTLPPTPPGITPPGTTSDYIGNILTDLGTTIVSPSTVIGRSATPTPTQRTLDKVVDDNVPLGNYRNQGGWSMLSMIMGILSVLVGVITLITVFRRKDKKEEETEVYVIDEFGNMSEASAELQAEREEEKEKKYKRSRLLKVLTFLTGLLPILVFLILDDLSQPMIWINRFTPTVALFFILNMLVLAVQVLYQRKHNEEEEDEMSDDDIAKA